ncbi:MAG: LegC family aminotransferase [Thiomicrorhabdus chilensis]|uniref:LegC family aminotransferase n=1 Tax=Thiomicrorhabdus chilensis TaxID=63656 RepID=UPI00299D726E|nr:LegC family aminotransferase [Thiomicrorhabdus chilensis]MDX1346903.1 LegC family aminotransferase [Thiomicrorhabdus chilensis]
MSEIMQPQSAIHNTQALIAMIRSHYQSDDFIPLHAPCLGEPEKQTLNACIDSTFVSSVGEFVTELEQRFIDYTGARHAVAVVNGTMGLFLALKVAGVESNDLVLTQSLTFVATANAIKMLQADPLFLDVDSSSYGLSADSLEAFLNEQACQKDGNCVHKSTGKVIRACVPMHTLGFAAEMDRIVEICQRHRIKVIEDAAESLGSFYQGQHTGTFGEMGVFSFNGNKIMTTGGGGMLVTNDDQLARHAKHLSTTAKIPHAWLFEHDEIAYNLRMPNLNAALGVAQFDRLPNFLEEKKVLADSYRDFLIQQSNLTMMQGLATAQPNYWLNGLILSDQPSRDVFLQKTNEAGIQTRPLWTPMHQLDMYKDCIRTVLPNTEWLAERVVNLPSGVKCHG